MRYALRILNQLPARRKAVVQEKPVMTTVVADHVSRTLLHQGYAELGEAERGLIDRIVAFAPHTAAPAAKPSLLDRIADRVAEGTRSWWFVAGFALVVAAWVLANSTLTGSHGLAFDPYPYDMLRFALTMVTTVQGPMILISQQRRATVDRAAAEYDAAVAVHTKLEILRLHKCVDGIERGLTPQVRVNADPRPPSSGHGRVEQSQRRCRRRSQSVAR